jgi:hypothetical protein
VVFTLLAECYERGSVVLTSNLPFSKWEGIFKDPMPTAAAIDRLSITASLLNSTFRAFDGSRLKATYSRWAWKPTNRHPLLRGHRRLMPEFMLSMLAVIRVFCQNRSDTALEILTLRQQIAVLKRKRPRPVLNPLDRLFWRTLRHFWSRWSDVLVIVKPETVINRRHAGFP